MEGLGISADCFDVEIVARRSRTRYDYERVHVPGGIRGSRYRRLACVSRLHGINPVRSRFGGSYGERRGKNRGAVLPQVNGDVASSREYGYVDSEGVKRSRPSHYEPVDSARDYRTALRVGKYRGRSSASASRDSKIHVGYESLRISVNRNGTVVRYCSYAGWRYCRYRIVYVFFLYVSEVIVRNVVSIRLQSY